MREIGTTCTGGADRGSSDPSWHSLLLQLLFSSKKQCRDGLETGMSYVRPAVTPAVHPPVLRLIVDLFSS